MYKARASRLALLSIDTANGGKQLALVCQKVTNPPTSTSKNAKYWKSGIVSHIRPQTVDFSY